MWSGTFLGDVVAELSLLLFVVMNHLQLRLNFQVLLLEISEGVQGPAGGSVRKADFGPDSIGKLGLRMNLQCLLGLRLSALVSRGCRCYGSDP